MTKPTATVIWTTTPWTIPANQALNFSPDLDYVVVETPHRNFILAEGLYEDALKRYGLEGKVIGKAKGSDLYHLRFKHPLPVSTKAMTDFHQSSSPITLMQQPVPVSFTVLLHTVWTTTSPARKTD